MSASNELKIEVMRAVREHIEDEHRQYQVGFLCHALGHVALQDPERYGAACGELESYIGSALKPHSTLHNWQEANAFGDRGDSQRRADRLAWIDWMILCLEGWEPFIPGEQPVGNFRLVRARLRNGNEIERLASGIRWFAWLDHGLSQGQDEDHRQHGHEHDVVAYRVIV